MRTAGFGRVLSKFHAIFSPDKFEYRLAVPNDREKIMKFLLTYFVKDEPCNRALKMPIPILEAIVSDTIDRSLRDPFSTIVTIPEKNGEVAGCLLNSVWRRADSLEGGDFSNGDFPENLQLFVGLLNSIHSNFWNLAPKNVDAVIHREIASVASPYMRRGISTRLLTENMSKTLLQKYQIGGVVSEATSFANQSLEEKNGFRCLAKKPYSDVVDRNGNNVLKLDDGATHLMLNFKAIEDFKGLPA